MTAPLPDFPDWTTPVADIESVSADLLGLAGINVPGSTATIDTSAYKSLVIAMLLPVAAIGTRYVMEAAWFVGAQPVDVQDLSFHSAPSYALGVVTTYWQLPVRGTSLQVTVEAGAAGNLSVQIFGSTRVIGGEAVSRQGGGLGRMLIDTGNVALAGLAASSTFYAPPVTSRLRARLQTGGATALHFTADGVNENAAALAATPAGRWDGTRNVQDGDIRLPGVGTEWVMTNDDAAARNLRLTVWDAS